MRPDITAKQVWSYLIPLLRPFPVPLGVMFLSAFVWAVDLSLKPYLIKVILNRLTEGAQGEVFFSLAGPICLYLGQYFLLVSVYRLYDYCVEIKMVPELRKKIAADALGKFVDKSHNYYQHHFSGSLTNKVNDLTHNVPEITRIAIERLFGPMLALVFAVFTLWQVNQLFGVLMLTWALSFVVVGFLLSKHLTRLADDWSECTSLITGKIVDILSNILSVRLFSSKNAEKKAMNHTFQEAVDAEQKLQWAYLWMWLFAGYSFLIIQGLNFYFLCKGRQEGWITVGDFALVLVINLSIVEFLWQLVREFSEFSKSYGRITQALRALLDSPELTDKPEAAALHVTRGQIIFEKVNFHYKGTDPLFQNKSVTLKAGEKVGLVGYSGGGKTTFVNLILRLYDVTAGRILIDGQNIQDCTQDSLRAAIGMIPQDPSLFHRSLRDNIRYGRASATEADVIEAAKRAHAHTFISTLPQGYDALVGERGVKLSGGERQRIAIARAILKNAPILILDEATSQLDSVTESVIQESLWELMQGKTTLVIAHRLSTLLHMDRILVLDKGRIVEDGPHTALLAKGGLYKTLWDAQVGGFLPA